jgi:hypothetical protein
MNDAKLKTGSRPGPKRERPDGRSTARSTPPAANDSLHGASRRCLGGSDCQGVESLSARGRSAAGRGARGQMAAGERRRDHRHLRHRGSGQSHRATKVPDAALPDPSSSQPEVPKATPHRNSRHCLSLRPDRHGRGHGTRVRAIHPLRPSQAEVLTVRKTCNRPSANNPFSSACLLGQGKSTKYVHRILLRQHLPQRESRVIWCHLPLPNYVANSALSLRAARSREPRRPACTNAAIIVR